MSNRRNVDVKPPKRLWHWPGWTHNCHPRQSTGFSPAVCYFVCRTALSWRQDYPDVPQLKCGRLPVACIWVGFVAEVSALIVGRCILRRNWKKQPQRVANAVNACLKFCSSTYGKVIFWPVWVPLRVAYNINNPLMKAGGTWQENSLLPL